MLNGNERPTSDKELEKEFSPLLSQKTAWKGGCERNSTKEVHKEDDLSQRKERCPACGKMGTLTNDVERGELFCSGCGTVFKEGESMTGAESKTVRSIQNLGLGELAPKRSEYSNITDHTTGRTESNIIASQYSHGEKELNAIREMAESAARWLGLPRNAEVLLTENTVRRATKLLALLRAGAKRVSLEKLTAYSLLSEAKKLGKSIGEVQSALARAQFKIPLLLLRFHIATSSPERARFFLSARDSQSDNTSMRQQQPLQFKMSVTKNEDTRTVELVRLYDLRGYATYTVKLNVELCDVLAVKPDIDSSQVSKLFLTSENALIRDGPKLESAISLEINPSKCFALFKRAEAISGEDTSVNAANFRRVGSALTNNLILSQASEPDLQNFARARLPSKFPISSMLMKEAGCLQKMEIEYMNAVKSLLSNPDNFGRTPSRLLLEALRLADRSVFGSVSPEIACKLGIKAVKLGLISSARKKTKITTSPIKSFLITEEVR